MPKRTLSSNGGRTLKRQKSFYARKPVTVPASVRKAVKAAVNRSRETKMVTNYANEKLINSINASPYLYAFPTPDQGPGSHQRIGNRITPVSLKASVLLHNNSSGGSADHYVRLMLVKITPGLTEDGEVFTDFFEGTNGLDTTLNGGVTDMIRPPNKEYLKVISDEVIHLTSYDGGSKVAIRHFDVKIGGEMVFRDNTGGLQPLEARYAFILINREADADEGIGSNVELSHSQVMFYKD